MQHRQHWVRIPAWPLRDCSSAGRAPDCRSEGRGFEPRQSRRFNTINSWAYMYQGRRSCLASSLCSVRFRVRPFYADIAQYGRATAFQADGCGFEPRCPLQAPAWLVPTLRRCGVGGPIKLHIWARMYQGRRAGLAAQLRPVRFRSCPLSQHARSIMTKLTMPRGVRWRSADETLQRGLLP